MGQGVVKYDIGGHLGGVIPGVGAEHLLILPFAGADDDQLEVVPQQIAHDGLDQVHALVPHQPGNHNDHRHIVPDGQPQPLLEELFVLRLLFQGSGVEVGVDQRVGSGVEHLGVDAVHHAAELVAVAAQHVVESMGKIGVLDLVGIGAGDGAHPVGGENRRLHQVGAAVELHGAFPVPGQAQHLVHKLVREPALVLHVVDGKQGADGLVLLRAHIERPEEHRNQSGLPVVGMDDVWVPIQVQQGLQDGLGEEGEALAVVIVPVAAVPVEVVLIVNEVVLKLLALAHGAEQAAVHAAPGQGDGEIGEVLNFKVWIVLDGLVVGQEHIDLGVGRLGQRLRQRRGHVAQTAGFDKGRGLAGG